MRKMFRKSLLLGFSVLGVLGMFAQEIVNAGETQEKSQNSPEILEQIDDYNGTKNKQPQAQVTSVSELRDVEPTSWAYEALKSLVERYGCIVGYPDRTFLGNRALTRWEFAAGLNACLNTMERLLQENVAVLKEDIDKLKRLAESFKSELAALGTRVDNIESRVAFLEDHQFSTTTKLQGEVLFTVANAVNNDLGNQTTFSDRVRLDFNTSFTGRDLLFTRITATNADLFRLTEPSPIAQTGTGKVAGVTANNTDLTVIPVKGPNEAEASTQGIARTTGQIDSSPNRNNNQVEISKVYYQVPFGNIDSFAFAYGGEHHDYVDTLNPFFDDNDGGLGTITTFSSENPIYRIGGGSGAAVNWNNLIKPITVTVGYLAGPNAASPQASEGLLNGNYAFLGQITANITERIAIAFTYVHGYHPAGTPIFDAGRDLSSTNSNGNIPGGGVVGTAVANNPAAELRGIQQKTPSGQKLFICQCTPAVSPEGSPVAAQLTAAGFDATKVGPQESTGIPLSEPFVASTVTNSYGIEGTFQIFDKIYLNAFGSYTDAILVGAGNAEIWTWGAGIAFVDLGKEGNVLGFFGGAVPYAGNVTGLGGGLVVDAVPYQVEGFYKWKINDNIAVTPAIIWQTAPNQNVSGQDQDAIIGLIRTTFTF